MKKLLLLIPFLLLFIQCGEQDPAPNAEGGVSANKTKTYTIPQGEHSSGTHIKPFWGKTILKFQAKFWPSCLYNLGDGDNYDINKLYGLTWGILNDDNSVRIGWNCEKQNGKIQIWAYFHKNGSFTAVPAVYLGDIDVNQFIQFHVDVDKPANSIHFLKMDGSWVSVPYDFSGVSTSFGYYNYPYFGGNETAPHDMQITIID